MLKFISRIIRPRAASLEARPVEAHVRILFMHFVGRLWQILRLIIPFLAKSGYRSRGVIATFTLPFLTFPDFVADRQITFKINDLKADSNHACTLTPQIHGACWNTPPSCCALITRDLLDSSPLRACNCNKQTELNTDTLLQIAQSALQGESNSESLPLINAQLNAP